MSLTIASVPILSNRNHVTFPNSNPSLQDIIDGDNIHSLDLNFEEILQQSENADISPMPLETQPVSTGSDVLHQLHGGHEDNFTMENIGRDTSPNTNGYTSDGSYAQYSRHKKSHLAEDYSNSYQGKGHIPSPQDQSFLQFKHNRSHPDSSPESINSELCASPHETGVYLESNRYMNVESQELERHRLFQHQEHSLQCGNSPSGDSTCSHQSAASSSMGSTQQFSPHDNQMHLPRHEFEKAMDSVKSSNSRAILHSVDPTLGGSQQSFLGNSSIIEQQSSGTAATTFHSARGQSNPVVVNDIHNVNISSNHSLPLQSQVVDPIMLQYLSSQINGPSAKKRKHSATQNMIPEPLNATLLSQQYQMMQTSIKQEPGLTSPNGTRGYISDAYEMNDVISRHHGNIQRNLSAVSSLPVTSLAQLQGGLMPSSESMQRHQTGINSSGSHYVDNNTYQVIKWSRHQSEIWCRLTDVEGKELPTVSYRVDADKGFNFAVPDDTFVCQKKNHFQVTVHIGVEGHPHFIKSDEGLKKIDAFYLDLYGVKYESISQTISIEQSQSDRSKKSFHPVKVDLPGDQVTKVTVGRLHFSETTANNMRKKGRPNPDQRYFMCVVALKAQAGGKSYMICASHTEKIIVRASNPGQFDSDDVQWQRAQVPEAIFHNGKVGINYDKPDEALVVHGNLKVTGRVMQPSDLRAKNDIQEVDPKEQLKNVQNVRMVRYKYTPEYCEYAGIDPNSVTTGVLAQEFRKVLPDAVKDTGDVRLENGHTIPNFLVVDKDQLFMENIGAVQALSDLSNNFESRIDQLERWNKKLAKLKKYDSIRSTASSMFSGISNTSQSNSSTTVSRAGSSRDCNHNSRASTKKAQDKRVNKTNARNETRLESSQQEANGFGCLNQKLTLGIVISLMLVMFLSFTTMAALYAISVDKNHKSEACVHPNCNYQGVTNVSGSAVSHQWRSTTTPRAWVRSTSVGVGSEIPMHPIAYCPDDGITKCGQESNYCCNNPGKKLFATCIRDYFVRDSVIQVDRRRVPYKYKVSKTVHRSNLPASGNSKKRPADRYVKANFETVLPAENAHSRFHKQKIQKQVQRHHPKIPISRMTKSVAAHAKYDVNNKPLLSTPFTAHDETANTLRPTAVDLVNYTTFATSNGKAYTAKQDAVTTKDVKAPSGSDFDTTNLPDLREPNDQKHQEIEEDLDQTNRDNIDTNQATKIEKIGKRARRSTLGDTDERDSLRLLTIRIVEPDLVVYRNGTESGYMACSTASEMALNIPVSSQTPPNLPMTIEFNTSTKGYIQLCKFSPSPASCPAVDVTLSEEPVTERVTPGTTHRFKINFANYPSSDYWFYSGEAGNSICSLPSEELGRTYVSYRLRFYRPCGSQMTEDDDSQYSDSPEEKLETPDRNSVETIEDQLKSDTLDDSISDY